MSNLPNMHKFPSVSSIHSMVSLGYLPPGHGYIPRKVKPDKPYGPSYIAIMNRTWRGPGRKYLQYALFCFCFAMLFYISSALYFGHRNVSRMIVKHSEPIGACLMIIAICLTALTFELIHRARLASNRWRSYTKFRADGLFHVAPHNEEYHPEDMTSEMATGTYGPRAVKEIPKPRHMRGRSKPGSRPGGRVKDNAMTTLLEDDENTFSDEMGSQDFLNMVPPQYNGNQPGPQKFNDMPLSEVHRPQAQRLEDPDEPYYNAQSARFPPEARRTPDPYTTHDGPSRMTPEPRYVTTERMPPPGRMTPDPRFMHPQARMTPEPRFMHPQARMTPEPRFMAQERMPPQGRMTPEPRYMMQGRVTPHQPYVPMESMPPPRMPPPGMRPPYDPAPFTRPTPETSMIARQTPDPTAGSKQTPESQLPTPQARMPAGAKASEPKLPPPPSRAAAGTFKTPEPRMAPGQAKLTTPQPRMAPGQGRPAAGTGRPPPK